MAYHYHSLPTFDSQEHPPQAATEEDKELSYRCFCVSVTLTLPHSAHQCCPLFVSISSNNTTSLSHSPQSCRQPFLRTSLSITLPHLFRVLWRTLFALEMKLLPRTVAVRKCQTDLVESCRTNRSWMSGSSTKSWWQGAKSWNIWKGRLIVGYWGCGECSRIFGGCFWHLQLPDKSAQRCFHESGKLAHDMFPFQKYDLKIQYSRIQKVFSSFRFSSLPYLQSILRFVLSENPGRPTTTSRFDVRVHQPEDLVSVGLETVSAKAFGWQSWCFVPAPIWDICCREPCGQCRKPSLKFCVKKKDISKETPFWRPWAFCLRAVGLAVNRNARQSPPALKQPRRPWSSLNLNMYDTSLVKIHKVCQELGETKMEARPACTVTHFVAGVRCGCLGGTGGPQWEQIFASFVLYTKHINTFILFGCVGLAFPKAIPVWWSPSPGRKGTEHAQVASAPGEVREPTTKAGKLWIIQSSNSSSYFIPIGRQFLQVPVEPTPVVQSEPHVEAAESRDTPASASGWPILVWFAAKRWHLILFGIRNYRLSKTFFRTSDFRVGGSSRQPPRPPTADMAMSFDRVQESWPENHVHTCSCPCWASFKPDK